MLISSYEKNYGDNPEIVGDSGEKLGVPDSGLTFVVKEFSCNDMPVLVMLIIIVVRLFLV